MHTRVRDLMERDPVLVSPDDTLKKASQIMRDANCGFLPVVRAGHLDGVITDRDIVVRALAQNPDLSQKKVRDYMTTDICACKENDFLIEAAEKMNENRVSRLVVLDTTDRIAGVLSYGHVVRQHDRQDEVSEVVQCATGRQEAERMKSMWV